ncbi:acriflavin resistance protein [Arcobacter sp. 31_11_sub10_T18]|nr:acriflavin resistance protein [Arcobacter sp. 31_11_sub10_T18]
MMRTLIEFGLKRPVLNHFILFFIFVLAIFSYFKIPKEIFPSSSLDSISISGSYAGASSDILDKMVVENIENELLTLSDADKINSVVKNGFFSITVHLKDDVVATEVINDVKDIITIAKKDFPSDMDEPATKVKKHYFPLITVALYGDSTTEELLDVAKKVKNRIMELEDLSEVSVWGDTDKELLITFDESKIDAYNLNKSQVINAVKSVSSIFPVGIIKDTKKHYYLSTFNGEKNISKIENMILKIDNKRLYLKDVAHVSYQLADSLTISHFNGKPNVSIGINKGKEGDAIELVREIKSILNNEFEDNYSNLKFDTYTDTSIWIKNRLNTVVSNILFGLFLLFLALMFFINTRIAIVVGIGIPTSFLIGLIAIESLGYSLNMLTLLGALIALGMLVDEAIVVGENIYRHMEMGKDKYTAAVDGALEIYPAVLTATATTILAFLPILLMTGEIGRFMQVLPVLIAVLLFSSLLEAFYFLPLHAKQLFKVNRQKKKADTLWDLNKKIYVKILDFLLKGKYITLVLLLSFIIGSTYLFLSNSKFELMPDFDTTQIYITGSVGVGKKLQQTEQLVAKIEKKLLDNVDFTTEVDSISSIIGMKLDGRNIPHNEEFYYQIFVNLHERAPENFFNKYINPYLSPKYDDSDMIRQKNAQVIEGELLVLLDDLIKSDEFEELNVFVPGAGIVKNDIEIALNGPEEKVSHAIDNIKSALLNIDGVSNVADDSLTGNVELKFKVNVYGQQLGISEDSIISQLRPFYFKGTYSKMFDDTGIVNIVFQSSNKDVLKSIDNFKIEIPNTNETVLLNEVVLTVKQSAYSQIFKENNKRVRSVTASINNITSAEVYKHLQTTLDGLDKNIHIKIKGEEEENQKFIEDMMMASVLAFILILAALVWMFDSLVKPLIILSNIPLSILGVMIGHYLLDMNLSMASLIGMVGLAGVIVNDGIIMMDFIKKSTSLDDIKEYALLRLRPIILTSITTVLGLSTLIFFASGQALILQPMAVSLGFGILWATVLNLYYVPMLYRIIYLRKATF